MTGGCAVHGTGNTEEPLHPSCFQLPAAILLESSQLSSSGLFCGEQYGFFLCCLHGSLAPLPHYHHMLPTWLKMEKQKWNKASAKTRVRELLTCHSRLSQNQGGTAVILNLFLDTQSGKELQGAEAAFREAGWRSWESSRSSDIKVNTSYTQSNFS